MRFSEQWLRSFCNPAISSQELAHALTMAGLEVEEVLPAAAAFDGDNFVIAWDVLRSGFVPPAGISPSKQSGPL